MYAAVLFAALLVICGGDRVQALAARRTSLLLACLLLVRGTAGKGTYPDMNERASLERVIRERSSDGQLVLYTYLASGPASKMWQDLALEMSDQLNRLAYPYIVLAHDASGCDELLAAAVGRVKPAPYCVLDGMMRKARGYAQHGTVFTLWIRRYHTAARLAEAGVGVTLLDADTVLTRNMLPVLKQLEREYALIGLGEGPMNGGTWHLRASNSSSAALWVIKQIERRSTLYQNFKPRWGGVDPGLRMDQEELGDALRVATTPNGSAFDFWNDFQNSQHKEHELWRRFQQTKPELFFQWKIGAPLSSPFLPQHCEWDLATCDRFERFATKFELGNVSTQYAEINVPFDSEMYDDTVAPEKVLRAPAWLFSMGAPLSNGFDKQIAAYHLLRVDLHWEDKAEGGMWHHVNRYVQWLARPGMRTYRETHGKPYVALAQHMVDEACTHLTALSIKRLVKHLMNYAIGAGAMPVMPRFPCNASWIVRSNESFLGYGDPRVVDDGTWCYPATAGYESCFPGKDYTYPFLVPANVPVSILEELPRGHAHDNSTSDELKRAHKNCAAFFKEFS